jgi:hypothetical protein
MIEAYQEEHVAEVRLKEALHGIEPTWQGARGSESGLRRPHRKAQANTMANRQRHESLTAAELSRVLGGPRARKGRARAP